MIKFATLILATLATLQASDPTQTDLNGIYLEALAFIGVFGTMGLISYVYLSRHAKVYSVSQEETTRKKDMKLDQERKEKRIEALSKMLDEELLTREEFAILRSHLL